MAKPTLKTAVHQFGDVTVHMEQLRPKKALRVSAILARFVLPLFSALKPTDEVTPELLNTALLGIAANMDPDTIEKLSDELLQSTIVMADGTKYDLCLPGKIDECFEGRFGVLLETLKAAIALNFAEHFGAVGLRGPLTPTSAP